MYKTIKTEKLPIMVWADDMDPQTLNQAKNLANLPSAFHHIAIMADTHIGYGMPIGGVLATIGTIVPNAVGVDIGCGMQTMQTSIKLEEINPKIDDILHELSRSIPMGFRHHKKPQIAELFNQPPKNPIIIQEIHSAKKQIGTLGGGNHFLEILHDENQIVWLMVHSGSRNFGYKTAEYYYKKARDINPEGGELAWFDINSKIGQEYFEAMNYCIDFAHQNRNMMMDIFIKIIKEAFGDFKQLDRIDTHHNYADLENHFGKEVVVHRKGAVRTNIGEKVVIPGSMGTPSYIAEGLGNQISFNSCSHGAGRAMGRRDAKRKIPWEKVDQELKKVGVTVKGVNKSDIIAESPFAYKDIKKVMKLQSDLAKPAVILKPVGVLIG